MKVPESRLIYLYLYLFPSMSFERISELVNSLSIEWFRSSWRPNEASSSVTFIPSGTILASASLKILLMGGILVRSVFLTVNSSSNHHQRSTAWLYDKPRLLMTVRIEILVTGFCKSLGYSLSRRCIMCKASTCPADPANLPGSSPFSLEATLEIFNLKYIYSYYENDYRHKDYEEFIIYVEDKYE